MAKLQVLALANIDVTSLEIVVHGQNVGLDGVVEVYGKCGDGVPHPLRYTVHGAAGAKFGLRISCETKLVFSDDIVIAAGCDAYESGPREFKL